jgi:hypothetical protein
MKTVTLITAAIAGALAFASVNSNAYPRHDPNVYDLGNLWSITAYNDDSIGHTQWATQRICFNKYYVSVTHIRGTWYSTTYPNWHGHWAQEGDSVKMVGNFWQGRGNDGITFDIVTSSTRNIGAGHWHEWGDNGQYGPMYGFANALLRRVGKCVSTAGDKAPEGMIYRNDEDKGPQDTRMEDPNVPRPGEEF